MLLLSLSWFSLFLSLSLRLSLCNISGGLDGFRFFQAKSYRLWEQGGGGVVEVEAIEIYHVLYTTTFEIYVAGPSARCWTKGESLLRLLWRFGAAGRGCSLKLLPNDRLGARIEPHLPIFPRKRSTTPVGVYCCWYYFGVRDFTRSHYMRYVYCVSAPPTIPSHLYVSPSS